MLISLLLSYSACNKNLIRSIGWYFVMVIYEYHILGRRLFITNILHYAVDFFYELVERHRLTDETQGSKREHDPPDRQSQNKLVHVT